MFLCRVGIDDSSDESDGNAEDNSDDNSEGHIKRKLADASSDDNSECHTKLKKRKLDDTSSDDDSRTELKVTDEAENEDCVAPIEKSAVDEESALVVGTQSSDCSGTEVQQVRHYNYIHVELAVLELACR